MDDRTFGERAADTVVRMIGSWTFVLMQTTGLVCWVIANSLAPHPWDPYPFILMNLMLSLQAAYTGPMVMMSQNRQAAIDRQEARDDFMTNKNAELNIRKILERMDIQDATLRSLRQVVESQSMIIEEELSVKDEYPTDPPANPSL